MSFPAPFEETNVYTVSQLNAEIRRIIESNYPYIWLQGEISNFRVPASGHFYFTLKDEKSQIRAVLFKFQQRTLRFRPEDGLQVVCQGRISVYEPRGEYQIIIEHMEPHGRGALQLAFEQLKKRLEKEGLFAADRKKPLPIMPQRIVLITSATGAAVRDILKVLRRSPYPLSVSVMPVRVQGNEAAKEIAAALSAVNRLADIYKWDLMVIGRGGGSLEDLWPFNEEIVARALACSVIPTISAVGHEIDLTITDLIADLRCPTPTAAAEWIVSQLKNVHQLLSSHEERLVGLVRQHLQQSRQKLAFFEKRLIDPRRRLADLRLFLDDRLERLVFAQTKRLEHLGTLLGHFRKRLFFQNPEKRIVSSREAVERLYQALLSHAQQSLRIHRLDLQRISAQLENLSPLAILARGYSVAYKMPEETVIRSYRDVKAGNQVEVRLHEGALRCTVNETVKEPNNDIEKG